MAMFTWRVTPDDGEPYIVRAGTRDVLAWEKDKPGRSAQQLTDDFHVQDAYWLAHRAARRAGQFDGTRREFEESVELETAIETTVPAGETDDGDAEDDADPIRPAR